MTGRAFLTLLAGTTLSLPAMAEDNATSIVSGWSITSSQVGCIVEYQPQGDQLRLRVERSYVPGSLHKLSISADFDWQIAGWNTQPILLRIAGMKAPIGAGTLFQQEGMRARAVFSIHGSSLELLSAAGGPITLQFVTEEGTLIGERQTDAFTTSDAMLTGCFENVGAMLLAARAPDDDGSKGERAPAPMGSPARWVTSNDYPSTPIRSEMAGRTTIRLSVDRFGFPISCQVLESSDHTLLDDITCKAMLRRARFFPARDANGDAVAGHYQQSISWEVP